MLSTSIRSWPRGGDWVLKPKWDGFRLLVDVDRRGRLRAWSRRGTTLTSRIGDLLPPLAGMAPDTMFDGELVALSGSEGRPVHDFATVVRAVFTGDSAAMAQLHFVAFDLLRLDGDDLRSRPWRERRTELQAALPSARRIRTTRVLPATEQTHETLVDVGFEGSVLKRPGSAYRPGRQPHWRKHKARHTIQATLTEVACDRDGIPHAVCDVNGRRIRALADAGAVEHVKQPATIIYSRTDADGSLREARLAPPHHLKPPADQPHRSGHAAKEVAAG